MALCPNLLNMARLTQLPTDPPELTFDPVDVTIVQIAIGLMREQRRVQHILGVYQRRMTVHGMMIARHVFVQAAHGTPATISYLQRELIDFADDTTIRATVIRMVDEGWITKIADSHDKRATMLYPAERLMLSVKMFSEYAIKTFGIEPQLIIRLGDMIKE